MNPGLPLRSLAEIRVESPSEPRLGLCESKSAATASYMLSPALHLKFRPLKSRLSLNRVVLITFKSATGERKSGLSTAAIVVTLDVATGALSFSSRDGTPVLSEPKEGGKTFDVPSVFETTTWQVQQSFLSPADEAMYGLGQHQEGIFDVRGVPIRLSQANTNISIPFLLSSKGYGILWNNASLTDFNPADQSIAIDPSTGKGKFTTGAKGVYGFVLTSDNKDRLLASCERAAGN